MNKLTYNVFADGNLIYLGDDEQLATTIANNAKASSHCGRLSAVGDGYAYDIFSWVHPVTVK